MILFESGFFDNVLMSTINRQVDLKLPISAPTYIAHRLQRYLPTRSKFRQRYLPKYVDMSYCLVLCRKTKCY